jgi:hypothetical protein
VTEVSASLEKSLTSAKAAGNIRIEALVLMNLGVTYREIGRRSLAVDYFQQSSQLYDTLGDGARAAENQYNRGSMLIEFGNP